MDYKEAIINILKPHNISYINIDDNESLIKIYNLFVKNIIFEPVTDCELLYIGNYYQYITKNYVEMEKYYLIAIEKGNSDAMNNYALYNEDITKNYVEMEKYYLMAIEKGNEIAMGNFAYHHNTKKNYIEMKKYYLMAIEKGNDMAMCNLGNYYKNKKIPLSFFLSIY
jgi:TPR repeat protein